jgi:cytoskeleton protein RodZ
MGESAAGLADPVSDSTTPEPIPALRALGQVLRQGREGQGLGIAELAGRLNMGEEQLEALEQGDAGRLPEPVFVIAQARRVANSLAINVDGPLQTLRESGQFQTKRVKVAELSPRTPARPVRTVDSLTTTSGLAAPMRAIGRLALVSGILAALTIGGSAGWQQWQRHQARRAQPAAPVPAAPTPTAGTNQLLLRSLQPSWLEVRAEGGDSLFRGTFRGEQRFPLGNGLQVLAGRPDLVLAQLGSGPAQPLGRIDQVRWRRFMAPAP